MKNPFRPPIVTWEGEYLRFAWTRRIVGYLNETPIKIWLKWYIETPVFDEEKSYIVGYPVGDIIRQPCQIPGRAFEREILRDEDLSRYAVQLQTTPA